MASTNSRKTATGRLDRRGELFGIRSRPGCKPAVEIRLPGSRKEKTWIAVHNMETAKRVVEEILPYIDGIKAFPPDHPDLPQLETFSRKEFEAFVLTKFQRKYPSVNQVPGSEERLGQEPGVIQSTATEVLSDSAHGFDHGMMRTDVPESSSAHFAVDKNLQNLHPPGREAFVLGIGDSVASSIIPEELRIPSTHMQGPASTHHLHQGPGVDQHTATQLPQGAVQNFSTSDLTHGSNQGENAELMMPTNGPQSIFAEFGVLINLQNAHPPASEALGSNLALCLRDSLAPIQLALEQICERRQLEDEMIRQVVMPLLQQISGTVYTLLGECATEGSARNTGKEETCSLASVELWLHSLGCVETQKRLKIAQNLEILLQKRIHG